MNERPKRVYADGREHPADFARDFLESAIADCETLTERTLDGWREQLEQAWREQEEGRWIFDPGSAGAYMDFLDSLFFYYGESARGPRGARRRGRRAG